jgi:periplasmic protein TonB
MALRALLFSSDGSTTSTLCQILTDLGIEAEICSEMLVAVERISRENYDAILVDWDQETEATFLLKTAREQKTASHALILALLQNDQDVSRSLQQGANSAIKKPVDPQLAQDTLSTARDLILSRKAEQKDKEARVAAAAAEVSAAAAEYVPDEPPAPKTGFVVQTAPRSAFEAEESAERHDAPDQREPQTAPSSGTASGRAYQAAAEEIKPLEKKKCWNEPKPNRSQAPLEPVVPEPDHSQDSTGVFSSLPEQEETSPEPECESQPRYLVFAMVAGLLMAAVLYVWAPGDSYSGRLRSVLHSLSTTTNFGGSQAQPNGPSSQTSSPNPASAPSAKSQDPGSSDPGPIDTTEVDPGKIEIIETKAIPKSGAQQPPSTEPSPDSDSAQTPRDPAAPPNPTAQAAPLQALPQPPPQVQAQPNLVPVLPPHLPSPAPEDSLSASDRRLGVIIPDSLKTTPSPAPASSLEPFAVPEETSRVLVTHRVDPDYPAQALPQRLEGPVVLQVWVAKDGTVRDLKLVKGYFLLGRAAFEAVKQWRFKPYNANGNAIDFRTFVTLTFKYPGSAQTLRTN